MFWTYAPAHIDGICFIYKPFVICAYPRNPLPVMVQRDNSRRANCAAGTEDPAGHYLNSPNPGTTSLVSADHIS